MLAILRQRIFGLLWTAGLISYTGDWVLLTVLPVVVYERTHSTLASGMVLMMYAVATLLMGSIAGVAIGSGLGDVVGIVPLYDLAALLYAAAGVVALGYLRGVVSPQAATGERVTAN